MLIDIYKNNDWAGNGEFNHDACQIRDCAADLGEAVYEALEFAADDLAYEMEDEPTAGPGENEVDVDGITYRVEMSYSSDEYLTRTCGDLSDRSLAAWFGETMDPEGVTTEDDDAEMVAIDLQRVIGNLNGCNTIQTIDALETACQAYIDEMTNA